MQDRRQAFKVSKEKIESITLIFVHMFIAESEWNQQNLELLVCNFAGGGAFESVWLWLCQGVCGDGVAWRGVATMSGVEVGGPAREGGVELAMPHCTPPPGSCAVTHEEGEATV